MFYNGPNCCFLRWEKKYGVHSGLLRSIFPCHCTYLGKWRQMLVWEGHVPGEHPQMNHLQFYPCPLGHLAGPWCTVWEVMRGTSSNALYKPELLLETRKKESSKWSHLSGGTLFSWDGVAPRPSRSPLYPSTKSSSPSSHQDFIKWWAAIPLLTPQSTPLHHHHHPHLPLCSLLRHFAPKPNEEIARLVADRPRVWP